LGAYKSGTDERVDRAIARIEDINHYLKQATDEKSNLADSVQQLKNMFPSGAN
jgi:flagellar biosynthesis/type III secretory pathway ATPase